MLKRHFFAALGAIAGSPLFRPCPKVRPDPTLKPVHTPTAIHTAAWTDYDLELLFQHLLEPTSPVTFRGLMELGECKALTHGGSVEAQYFTLDGVTFRMKEGRWCHGGRVLLTMGDVYQVLCMVP